MNITNQLNNDELQNLPPKLKMYSRTSAVPSSPEPTDGKRHHLPGGEEQRANSEAQEVNQKSKEVQGTNQCKKKVNQWKGQVQEIKKHIEPSRGEASGINVATSRECYIQELDTVSWFQFLLFQYYSACWVM